LFSGASQVRCSYIHPSCPPSSSSSSGCVGALPCRIFPHPHSPTLPPSLYPSFSFASSSSSGRGDALPVPHFFAPTRAPQGLGSAAPIRGPFVGRRAAGHGHIRPLQVRTGILASFPRRCVWKVVEEGDGGRGISVLVLALFGLTENWNYCRLSVARPPFVRQAEA